MRTLAQFTCTKVAAGGWPRSNRRLAAPYYHTAGRFQHAPQASSKKGPYQVLPQVTCLEDLAKLLDESPLAREAMDLMADMVMAERVYIYHTTNGDNAGPVVVQRQSLLDACSSLDSLHTFLREQLGIAASQDIDVSWSDDAQPSGKQVQLIGSAAEAGSLAYFVGRSNGWFVGEK